MKYRFLFIVAGLFLSMAEGDAFACPKREYFNSLSDEQWERLLDAARHKLIAIVRESLAIPQEKLLGIDLGDFRFHSDFDDACGMIAYTGKAVVDYLNADGIQCIKIISVRHFENTPVDWDEKASATFQNSDFCQGH